MLMDPIRFLDFDIKRMYFRTELERLDEDIRLVFYLDILKQF